MTVNCIEPKIIVNPSLPHLMVFHRNFVFDGQPRQFNLSDSAIVKTWWLKDYRKLAKSISIDDIDNYYVIGHDGVHYPIFIAAKCGHCPLCLESKHNSIAARLMYEAQLYTQRPYFVTLTYRQSCLPDDGVSVRDCQLFLKRLRINLVRNLNYNNKIRYYLCSEYGQSVNSTHRPHYHLIIYNLPSSSYKDISDVKDIILRSWKLGFVQSRVIDMRNPTCFYYTSKYINKVTNIPDGKNQTFALSSRGKGLGGIGAPFLKQFAEYMFQSKSSVLQYVDKFTAKVKNIILDHYSLSKLLPSFCETVKINFRNACTQFVYLYDKYSNFSVMHSHSDLYNDIHSILLPYMSFPHRSQSTPTHINCPQCVCKYMYHLAKIINKYLYSYDFETIKKVDYARRIVTKKLISTLTPLTQEELFQKSNLISIKQYTKEQSKLLHHV